MEVAITTDNLVCSSCMVGFQTQSEYKQHYGTKFHQYNIKRKLINLPPATLQQYEERLNQFSQKTQQQKDSSFKAKKNYCDTCGKGFGNENTFKAHMISKKHSDNEDKKSQKSQSISKQSSQSNIYSKSSQRSTLNDQSICLFCDDKKPDLEINLIHMEKKHGFFIPEKKYVSDMKGLLKYLAEKINIGLLCIECENKGYKDFKTPEALKTHMIDKGHCFMSTKTFQEYSEFYDFSVNKENDVIEESQQEEDQENLQNKKKKREESLENASEGEENDEEWEDEESDDFEDEDEEEEEQEDLSGKQLKEGEKTKEEKLKKKQQEKNFIKNYKKLNLDRIAKFQINHLGEVELTDQGKTLGHRKYKHQYNTYYRNRADPLSGLKTILGDSYAKTRQVMIQNKVNQIALANKFQRHQIFRKEELQNFKHKFRDNKYKLWVQLNNNQTTMHHYRNQNPL